jgi:hypothetical protein
MRKGLPGRLLTKTVGILHMGVAIELGMRRTITTVELLICNNLPATEDEGED